MYEQKEIVLMPFPYTDLTSYKLRPALIISNKFLNKTEDRICCLITSVQTKGGFEIEGRFKEHRLQGNIRHDLIRLAVYAKDLPKYRELAKRLGSEV